MDSASFGYWLRRRRKALDLTQDALAQKCFCALDTIKKIEADLRRPSREMAEKLAEVLEIAPTEREVFVATARGEQSSLRLKPATAAIPAASHNTPGRPVLPAHTTPLIGRDSELAQLRALLTTGHARLVTLTALGGMGKSHLALAAAHALTDQFADGACFVPLVGVAQAGQVIATIARSLDIEDLGGLATASALARRLRDRHLLLVLDRAEHLTAAANALLELLRDTRQLRILITSRVVLGMPEEHVLRLAPMPLAPHNFDAGGAISLPSDATRMLRARADMAGATLPDSAETDASLEDICRRLDGIPLALQVAASRLVLLAPQQFLARLDRRLELAPAGRSTGEPRISLGSVIDESYRALSATAQHALRWLGVCVDGCSLDVARALGAREGESESDIEDDLVDLLNANLLQRDPAADRLKMHDIVREFAQARLADAGELDAARARHVKVVRDAAFGAFDATTRPSGNVLHELLASDLGNVREAIRHGAAGLGSANHFVEIVSYTTLHAIFRGFMQEWLAYLDRAGQMRDQCNTQAQLALHYALDNLIFQWIRPPEPSELKRRQATAAQGLALANAENHKANVQWHEQGLALVAVQLGDLALAQQHADACIRVAGQSGNPWRVSMAELIAGQLAFMKGDMEESVARLERCVATARKLEASFTLGRRLPALVHSLISAEEIERARLALTEVLPITREFQNHADLPMLYAALSRWAATMGKNHAAVIFAAAIHAQGGRTGYWVGAYGFRLFDLALSQVRAAWPDAENSDAWRFGETASVAQLLDLAEKTLSSSLSTKS